PPCRVNRKRRRLGGGPHVWFKLRTVSDRQGLVRDPELRDPDGPMSKLQDGHPGPLRRSRRKVRKASNSRPNPPRRCRAGEPILAMLQVKPLESTEISTKSCLATRFDRALRRIWTSTLALPTDTCIMNS